VPNRELQRSIVRHFYIMRTEEAISLGEGSLGLGCR
jgi:hypothetical protein